MRLSQTFALLLLSFLPLLSIGQEKARLLTVKVDLLGPLPHLGEALSNDPNRTPQFAPMLSEMTEWRLAPGHGLQFEAGLRRYARSWDGPAAGWGGWEVRLRDWRLSVHSRHYWGRRRLENRGWFGGGMLSMGRYRQYWRSDDIGGNSDARVWQAGGLIGRKCVAWRRLSVDVTAGLEAGLAEATSGGYGHYPYTGQTTMRGNGRVFYGGNFFVLRPTVWLLVGVAL